MRKPLLLCICRLGRARWSMISTGPWIEDRRGGQEAEGLPRRPGVLRAEHVYTGISGRAKDRKAPWMVSFMLQDGPLAGCVRARRVVVSLRISVTMARRPRPPGVSQTGRSPAKREQPSKRAHGPAACATAHEPSPGGSTGSTVSGGGGPTQGKRPGKA